MVLDAGVLAKCDGNVTPDAQPDDPKDDPSSPNAAPLRSQMMLDQMVSNVRAAVRNAGHTPLSILPGSIPPEAFDFVLYMAAWRLINSTPNLQMVVITEKGAYAPMADLAKQASEWVDGKVEGGRRVGGIATHAITPPDDPCGRDWKNPICVPARGQEATFDWSTFNPPIPGTVRSVSTLDPVDMALTQPGRFPDCVREELGAP